MNTGKNVLTYLAKTFLKFLPTVTPIYTVYNKDINFGNFEKLIFKKSSTIKNVYFQHFKKCSNNALNFANLFFKGLHLRSTNSFYRFENRKVFSDAQRSIFTTQLVRQQKLVKTANFNLVLKVLNTQRENQWILLSLFSGQKFREINFIELTKILEVRLKF